MSLNIHHHLKAICTVCRKEYGLQQGFPWFETKPYTKQNYVMDIPAFLADIAISIRVGEERGEKHEELDGTWRGYPMLSCCVECNDKRQREEAVKTRNIKKVRDKDIQELAEAYAQEMSVDELIKHALPSIVRWYKMNPEEYFDDLAILQEEEL